MVQLQRFRSYHVIICIVPRNENAPRLYLRAFQMSSAYGSALHSRHYYDTIPKKISVLPNVVGHWVITSGLVPVRARKASTAAHGVALRESVHTAKTCEASATAVM